MTAQEYLANLGQVAHALVHAPFIIAFMVVVIVGAWAFCD